MPHIRSIKPDFFTDADIGALPPLERLAFIGLWTLADREGRLECDPRELGVRLLPYDDADMEVILTRLAIPKPSGQPFIIRYTANEHHYIQIVNFPKHQRPHKLEAQSTLPSPIGRLSDSYRVATAVREDASIEDASIEDASIEDVGSKQSAAANGLVFAAYQANIGLLTPIIADQLRDLMGRAPPEWIVEAIGIAAEANVRKLRYVETIVERWLVEGKDDGRTPKNQRSRPGTSAKRAAKYANVGTIIDTSTDRDMPDL